MRWRTCGLAAAGVLLALLVCGRVAAQTATPTVTPCGGKVYTYGPNTADSVIQNSSGCGSGTWNDPSGTPIANSSTGDPAGGLLDDDTYLRAVAHQGSSGTWCLVHYDFDFNIPTTGHDITTVAKTVRRYRTGNVIWEEDEHLVTDATTNPATQKGSEKARGVDACVPAELAGCYPTSETAATITWDGRDGSWTAADLNSGTFGTRLRARASEGAPAKTAFIDSVDVTVTTCGPAESGGALWWP